MSRYDFKSLSSQDFEELARDLLQAEWNVRLEAFKAGKDKGIDLRYAPAHKSKTIIQCKHFVGSGFAKLLTHLRDSEKPKIVALSPRRYVIVTSVGLTPGNKDEIARALYPFVVNVGDIIGAEDIEGLLSRHPAIERANFKLWLTSTNVIERVVHNAGVCQTEFEVDRIRRKLPLFVQSSAFPRAMEILNGNRVVVISGVPGIGKTTLAEMLLYTHLEQGYEPVVIKAEIAEGKTFFTKDAKRVFYYDDFLGQIYLGDRGDYLGRNQDAALTDFIDMVQHSSHARFILTTREHILRTALQISEKLAKSPMLEHRCVLELSDYSYGHKARILYNHLYFSNLPLPYKKEILQGDFFFKIIKHEHFSPRLIEWLSTHLREREVAATDYREYISRLLRSPHEIWKGAFRTQISNAARDILLSLYTLGTWVDIIDLEPAFRSLHGHKAVKYNQSIAPGDFRRALQELDGAFLSYDAGTASYLNPSIREFIGSVICEDRDTTEDLLKSAIRFKQIRDLWELSVAEPNCELAAFLTSNTDLLTQGLLRLLHGPSLRWEKTPAGMRGYYIDMEDEARIGFVIKLAETRQSNQIFEVVAKASDHLVAGWDRSVPDFSAVWRLLGTLSASKWVAGHGGRPLSRKILDALLNHLTFAAASDWLHLIALPKDALEWSAADQTNLDKELKDYCENGVRDDRSNCNTPDELTDLRDSLNKLGIKVGYDFISHIQRLDEAIAERPEEEAESLREGSGIPKRATAAKQQLVSDDEVRQMFETLVSE
jgi:hypothetical protein